MLFNLQSQFVDHGLRNGIDGFDCGQNCLAGLTQPKQQPALDGMQAQELRQTLGMGVVAAITQLVDKGVGLPGWVLCHGPQTADSEMRPQ